MSPQKQEQSKNQYLPRFFFLTNFVAFLTKKLGKFWNVFSAANYSNSAVFKKNHRVSDIKNLGKKRILHRQTPEKV
jgi:Fic family protein